jgi:hypothetical protein
VGVSHDCAGANACDRDALAFTPRRLPAVRAAITLWRHTTAMPYLKIQTNIPVSHAAETAVVNEATALLVRELHRPSDSVAIAVESNTRLFLAGTDEPAAFVEVESTNLPPQGRALGEALADLIHLHIGVPAARVYVKFVNSTAAQHHLAA